MKNKKLLWLPVVLLVVLAISLTCVFVGCGGKEPANAEPTQPTQGPTEPAPTQPTEPEQTEPEETQPEPTEPEETEDSDSGSSGPNVNTGTGGGYDPGASDPGVTEPEADPTEPVIEVPKAGSEKNPYFENIKDGAGEFTTVKIPAGETVHYRIQTAGAYLQVEDGDVSVAYNETTYEAQEDFLELELPADDSQVLTLSFTNNGQEDKNFPVAIVGLLGSRSNPIPAESLDEIAAGLEQDDVDGLFYRWVADGDGMLKLWQETDGNVDLNVFVEEEAVQLTRDNGGKLCAPVEQEDEILIQVLVQADSEGNIPAAQTTVKGYIAPVVELSVMLLPFEAEPVTVAPGRSVYFTVTGAAGKYLQITAENAIAYYGEETLQAENGEISLTAEENTLQLELCNPGDRAEVYTVKVNHPLGSILNPQLLTSLGDALEARTTESGGHYYLYTAPAPGIVTFQIWTDPEDPNAITNIVMTNNTTGQTASLAESEDGIVSLSVTEGDELSVYVSVENVFGVPLAAQLAVMGNHYGTAENPILVAYPGFTANVPAGKTMYYQGINMNGILFDMTGTGVTVEHNGETYTDEVSFAVVSQGRDPAVFAITNHSDLDGQYEVVFTYPLGWAENPAELVLGTNVLTQQAGAGDYYYTFTAPRAGKLSLIFDENAQWTYGVNNLTQGIYGDTQWSDSDPLVARTELTVKKNDRIQIFVNTYDKENTYENPAATVTFTAEFVSGPTVVTNLDAAVTVNLIPGEYAAYSGQFYGRMLNISGAGNTVVYYNGTAYRPNAGGKISVEFPEGSGSNLEFRVHNEGTANITCYAVFGSTDVGSDGNPDTLVLGENSVTFDGSGSNMYYYSYTAEERGTLILTFGGDVDCMYLINDRNLGYSNTQKTYRVTVRAGQTVTIAVRTYDPADPKANPEGTVTITAQQ